MAAHAAVAKDNPYAWFQNGWSAEEITTVTADNRWICFPYPKRMNAIMDVDQAAAVVVMSSDEADRRQIPVSAPGHLSRRGVGRRRVDARRSGPACPASPAYRVGLIDRLRARRPLPHRGRLLRPLQLLSLRGRVRHEGPRPHPRRPAAPHRHWRPGLRRRPRQQLLHPRPRRHRRPAADHAGQGGLRVRPRHDRDQARGVDPVDRPGPDLGGQRPGHGQGGRVRQGQLRPGPGRRAGRRAGHRGDLHRRVRPLRPAVAVHLRAPPGRRPAHRRQWRARTRPPVGPREEGVGKKGWVEPGVGRRAQPLRAREPIGRDRARAPQ